MDRQNEDREYRESREERDNLTHNTVRMLIMTSNMHHRAVDRHAAGLGIHQSQHRMLMHLAKFDKIPSQKEIAEHFDISPAAVATTLKRLEKDGYIEKSKSNDRDDSRFNEISITEKGRTEAEETKEYFRHVDTVMFDGIDDEEIKALCALFEKLQSNLSRLDCESTSAAEKTCETNLPHGKEELS